MIDAPSPRPSTTGILNSSTTTTGGERERRESGRMQAMQEDSLAQVVRSRSSIGGIGGGRERIKIGMSKLHNPNGKVSFVGL